MIHFCIFSVRYIQFNIAQKSAFLEDNLQAKYRWRPGVKIAIELALKQHIVYEREGKNLKSGRGLGAFYDTRSNN